MVADRAVLSRRVLRSALPVVASHTMPTVAVRVQRTLPLMS